MQGLALVYAVFTVTALPYVLKFLLGKQLWDVGKRLLQCWEVLEDPDERLVFEAIFRLQGKRSGEILKIKELSQYSQAPTLWESDVQGICLEVGSSLMEREVRKTLGSLKERGIIAERDGRWSIAF
jgi:hypothetical protein